MASQKSAALIDVRAREAELPAGWEASPLEEVVVEATSGDWGQDAPGDHASAVKVLRGTDFEDASRGRLERAPVRYLKRASLEERRLRPGDLLVELSGGSKDQPTGRALLVSERLLRSGSAVAFSNFVKRLHLDRDRVDPEFAAYFWTHLYREGRTRTYEKRTTGIRNFKLADFLKNEAIILPPIGEQRAIAFVLRGLQQTREATEKVMAATRELKRSIMVHLFTYGPVPIARAEDVPLKDAKIGLIPEHWPVVTLGDVCERPQYGLTASASAKALGPKFLRITDLTDDGVQWEAVPFVGRAGPELDRYRLDNDDIVVARIGATTGKSYLVCDPPDAVFASYLIRIRAKPNIDPGFLALFMSSDRYWSQVDAAKGGRLKLGVNIPVLSNLVLPLPPMDQQEKISAAIRVLDKKIANESRRRLALSSLFDSLLMDLMTGQRRVARPEVA